jgi:hypothetical protein
MIQTSLAKPIALIAAGGLMSCLFAAVSSSAAEIKVLTSVALTSAFSELAPNFEQATGNKLNIGYSLIADIRKRMLDGETADVIILSRPGTRQSAKVRIRQHYKCCRHAGCASDKCWCAQTRHQHGRCTKAYAARCQIDCLCGPGKGRRERRLFCKGRRPSRNYRPIKVEDYSGAGRPGC